MSGRRDDLRTDVEESQSSKAKSSEPCDANDKAVGNPAAVETYFSEKELDEEFADRYTEGDAEYAALENRPTAAPPVISPW